MAAPRLDVRSAWGLKPGDRVAVGPPQKGQCRPGPFGVARITGPGEFRKLNAHFPASLEDGSSAELVLSYVGSGSEVSLVTGASRVY